MGKDKSVILVGEKAYIEKARAVVESAGLRVAAEYAGIADVPFVEADDRCLLLSDDSPSALREASELCCCVALVRDWDAAQKAMEHGAHDACPESEAARELPRCIWRAVRVRTAALACRDAEKTQGLISDIAHYGYWRYDFSTGEGRCSEGLFRLAGLDPAVPFSFEALRKKLHVEDVPLIDAGIRRALRRSRPFNAEFRIRLADGTERHVRTHAEPFPSGAAKASGLEGVMMDISASKEAEERFVVSKMQLDEAQRVARIGSWEMDAKGHVVWSGGLLAILGCTEGDLDSFESMRRFVHPEDRDIFDQANRATREGWPLDFEYRIINMAGEVRFLQLHRRVELDGGGKLARAFGIARDITSQKRFESTLEKRDAILQAVSTAAGRFLREKVWEDEIEHILETLGHSAGADSAMVLRYSKHETGAVLASMLREWDAPGFSSLLELPELQDVPFAPRFSRWLDRQISGRAVAGVVRTFPQSEREFLEPLGLRSILLVPIMAGDSLWGGMALTARREEREWLSVEVEALHMAADILGSAVVRNRMEQELLVANRDAEEAKVVAQEASKAKSRFLANMSHEIRTPISGVIGLTEMTITTGLKPEQRQNLNMIRDAARSLLNIINDVLDLSKIEAEKMHLAPEDFELRAAIERVVKPFMTQVAEKNVVLDLVFDEGIPQFLNGDPERLGQIVRNLVSNAVKFTDEGHVEVVVSPGERLNGRVHLHFRVSDTGIGIPDDQIDTIFDSFTQADISRGKRHQGTGLGLAICRELVAMMGGRIDVKSRVGRGTVFEFDVWFDSAQGDVVERDISRDAVSGAFNLNILMAEDNPLNRKFLTHFLTMFGHQVTVADNGLEALEILRREGKRFDLILMDIQMPEMDGMEATRRIRASSGRQFRPDIPIIALTAYAMKGDRDRMLEVGMNDYVTKPVDMEQLSAAIARQASSRKRSASPDYPSSPPPGIKPVKSLRTVVLPSRRFALDVQALESRFQGSGDLLREILDIFLREASGKARELQEALERRDGHDAAVTLHSVANLVSHVHALEAMEDARTMERRILDGDEEGVFRDIPRMLKDFEIIVEAVEHYRKTL